MQVHQLVYCRGEACRYDSVCSSKASRLMSTAVAAGNWRIERASGQGRPVRRCASKMAEDRAHPSCLPTTHSITTSSANSLIGVIKRRNSLYHSGGLTLPQSSWRPPRLRPPCASHPTVRMHPPRWAQRRVLLCSLTAKTPQATSPTTTTRTPTSPTVPHAEPPAPPRRSAPAVPRSPPRTTRNAGPTQRTSFSSRQSTSMAMIA